MPENNGEFMQYGEWGNQMPFDPNAPGSPIATPPADSEIVLVPETLTNPLFTPGFLATQIGKLVRVEFLVGDSMNDRVGILRQVGASFILLESLEAGSNLMCDLFSIKFVTIINNPLDQLLYGMS